MNQDLVNEYVEKIEPILSLAKKAYGSREQDTPQHRASREYTRLLREFHHRGGSLPTLAKNLGVAYAGVRRRVVMSDVSVSELRPKVRVKDQDIKASANRIRFAKQQSVSQYHTQIADEYKMGISLSALAKELGLSSAAPLYYGVQRSVQRSR
jgi:hypothetical protein